MCGPRFVTKTEKVLRVIAFLCSATLTFAVMGFKASATFTFFPPSLLVFLFLLVCLTIGAGVGELFFGHDSAHTAVGGMFLFGIPVGIAVSVGYLFHNIQGWTDIPFFLLFTFELLVLATLGVIGGICAEISACSKISDYSLERWARKQRPTVQALSQHVRMFPHDQYAWEAIFWLVALDTIAESLRKQK